MIVLNITIVIDHGLSAVYNAFEPDLRRRTLGPLYSVVADPHMPQELKRDYLYLGFHVDGTPSMAFKSRFRSLEVIWTQWYGTGSQDP